MTFLKYSKNVYSQNGEDGIIEELFKRLEIHSGYLCEFGAWDGVGLSNTFNVYEHNKDFKCILIESNKEYYESLLQKLEHVENKICLNKFIRPEPDHQDSLDNILLDLKIEELDKDFALLSIDVDSCDYEIWKGLTRYRPKVVVIEVNSSYPPNERVYPCTPSGASAAIVADLAKEKGYKIICHTGNLIFVVDELFDMLGVEEMSLDEVFQWSWVGIGDRYTF